MVFTGRLARKLETFDNKFLGFHDSGVLTELHSIAAELNTNEFPKPSTTSYPLRRGRKKTSTTTTQKADNSTKACSDRPQSLLRAPSCMLDATSRKTQCSTTDSTAKKDTDPIQKSLIAIESIMGEGDSKDDETCAIESNVPENTIGSTPPVQFDVTQLTLQSDAEQQPTLSDSDPMEHGVTVPVDGCIPNAMAVSNAMALAPDSIKLKQHGFPTKNQMKGMETKKWSSKDNNDPATATTGIQDAPFKVGTRVFRWSMNRDKEDTNFQSLHDSGVFTELQDIVAGIDKNDFPMPSARRGKKTKQAISPRSTLPSSPSSQEGALMADVPSEGNLGEQKGEEATSTSVEPDEASFVRTSVLRQPSMDLDDLIEASRLYKEQTRAQVQDHAGEEFCPPAENPGTSEIKTRPRNSSPESAVAVKKLSSRVKTNYQSFHDSGVLTELQDIAARLDKHEFIKPSLRRRKKKPSAFSSPTKQNQLEPDARLSSDGIIESPVGTNELVEPYTPKMESKPTERSVRKKSHKQSKSQQQIGADNEPRVHPDVERNLSKEKISPVDFKKASAQGKAPDSKNGVSRRTRKTIEPESNFKSLHDSGVFLELHLIVDEIGKEEFPKPSQSRRRGMKKAPLPSTSKTCQKEPKEKSQKAGTSCESDSKIVEVHSTTSRLTGVESKLKRTEKMDAGMSRHSVNDGSKKRSANRKLDNVISRLTAKPESRSTNHQLLQKQLETVTESMSLGLKKATVGIDQSDRVAKSPKDLEQCAGVEKVASSGVSHSPTRGESSNDSGTRTRYRRASISGGPAGSSRGRSSNGRQTSTRRGSISGDPPATSPDRNFQPATSPDRNFQPSPSSQRKRSAVLNFLERVSPANRRRSLSSSHAERSSRTGAYICRELWIVFEPEIKVYSGPSLHDTH